MSMQAIMLASFVILMLGTNDFQFSHPYNDAWSAAQGMATLVNEIRNAPIEPGMPVPPILLVCPPQIRSPRGSMAEKFRGADFLHDADRTPGRRMAHNQIRVGIHNLSGRY